MQFSWEVTSATLVAGAASAGRGATTVFFAPVQGFFAVPHAKQVDIQVSWASLTPLKDTNWDSNWDSNWAWTWLALVHCWGVNIIWTR